MTLGAMVDRVLSRVGEDRSAPVYYKTTEVVSALNEAQRLFAFLTLCLESTGSLTLTLGTAFYHLHATFPTLIVPLRICVGPSGARVIPGRLTDFDAYDSAWQARPGDPEFYQVVGMDLMAIAPQPDGAHTLSVTFARMPTLMAGASTVPEIPANFHALLEDYAVYRLRAKEGGQEFTKVIPLFTRFMAGAAAFSFYVQKRTAAAGYDRLPFELRKAKLNG